jgi:hypothetical protein
MQPVVCHIVPFYGTIYTAIISMNKNDTNLPAFVYLAKASLHVSALAISSSDESIEV